jgi:hypothetical protein
LYGRKCNTSVSWDNPTNIVVIGPKFIRNMEEKMVKEWNLKVTRDKKNSCAEKIRAYKEFIVVGEHVFLKVKAKRTPKIEKFPKVGREMMWVN